jgi:Zn-dependent protease with chaperone function
MIAENRMDSPPYYPPSPPGVPAGLTVPPLQYRRQAGLVVLSLAMFALLYFSILAGALLFLVWSVDSLLFADRGQVSVAQTVVQLVLGPPIFLLFVYLLKNLFRRDCDEKSDCVEIFAEGHPRLFDFIRRVCDETAAPYPKRVFVNCDVNAIAYCHSESFWHLFFPAPRNLQIGLGLVHVLNLTEFKALLAHEFGHFSQKSVGLGGYVYIALGVVNRIADGRDFFDRLVDDWCRLHPFVSWPTWIFYLILWSMRRMLIGLRYAMFVFHVGLMRQMELNADLVAVSVAGSDAPVHLLVRGTFADRCMKQTVADLQTALDHRLCTRDLFYHLDRAAAYLRVRLQTPDMGKPPALPVEANQSAQIYDADNDEGANWWSTHPSYREREQNARAHYIRTEFDERSAWLLFDDADRLRAAVTREFYAVHCKLPAKVVAADPADIQAFIDDERAEMTYDSRYHGLYDHRNLELDDIAAVAEDARCVPARIAQLMHEHGNLWSGEVHERGRLHNQHLSELHLLQAVAKGSYQPRDNAIEFRGKAYGPGDADRLLCTVNDELEQDRQWLADLDRRVFMTHFQMALHMDTELADALCGRYRFHIELQKIWTALRNQDSPVGSAIDFLQNLKTHRLDERTFQQALPVFRAAHHALRDALRAAEDMAMPALKNMPAGQPLRHFLLEKKLVDGISKHDQAISGPWIKDLLSQMREVQKKVDRIHFKSLGGILALQERISADCLQRWAQLPTASPS